MSPDALSVFVDGSHNVARDSNVTLTAREHEVLRLVATGMSNAEVARFLVISERTVKFHVSNVMHKMGARGRAEVTACAYRCGFMDSDAVECSRIILPCCPAPVPE